MAYSDEETFANADSHVAQAMKALDIELNKLDSMVEEVDARLAPILSPEGSPTARGTADLTSVRQHSEHVEQVDRMTAKVADVHQRLRVMVERLDI